MASATSTENAIAPPAPQPARTPFDVQMVSISKAEHIQLKWDANYWRTQFGHLSAHRDRDMQCLKAEMARRDACSAQALCKLKAELEQSNVRATQALSEVQASLEKAQAHIKDLQKRLFGQKSEKSKGSSEKLSGEQGVKRPRGHQQGQPGHGRPMATNLPVVVETVDLPEVDKCCPDCGLALSPLAETENSEVIEIEVKAYRRLIRQCASAAPCRRS